MQNRKGFTLIELLVVVLIIGILAAVAVPQYQLAVEKAKAVEAFNNIRALVQAEKIYEMANGSPTTDLTALSISIPTLDSNQFTYYATLVPDATYKFSIYATRIHKDINRNKYQIYSSAYLGTNFCVAFTVEAKAICKNLCHGEVAPDDSRWKCQIK